MLDSIFANNRKWAEQVREQQADFFERSSTSQNPNYLWIGCADSRMPVNQITGLEIGEIFVHRNIANVVAHTDFNCLSVLQYAVEVLKVEHVIVAGHYGCGGVTAALSAQEQGKIHGLLDNWLRYIRDVYRLHYAELQSISDFENRCRRLCELNVAEQVANVENSGIVQQAWKHGQNLRIHGWIYNLQDGCLRDLDITR